MLLSPKLSESTAAFMSVSNRRTVKTLPPAALITLGLVFFLLQCSRWDPDSRRVLSILDTLTKLPPAASIPEKIWYKVGPKGINNETREWMNTCLEKNPTFEHQILTDSSADAYVIGRFAHRPDIVEPISLFLFLSSRLISSATYSSLPKVESGAISMSRAEIRQSGIGYPENTRRMPVSLLGGSFKRWTKHTCASLLLGRSCRSQGCGTCLWSSTILYNHCTERPRNTTSPSQALKWTWLATLCG